MIQNQIWQIGRSRTYQIGTSNGHSKEAKNIYVFDSKQAKVLFSFERWIEKREVFDNKSYLNKDVKEITAANYDLKLRREVNLNRDEFFIVSNGSKYDLYIPNSYFQAEKVGRIMQYGYQIYDVYFSKALNGYFDINTNINVCIKLNELNKAFEEIKNSHSISIDSPNIEYRLKDMQDLALEYKKEVDRIKELDINVL